MIYLIATRRSSDHFLDMHLKQKKLFCPDIPHVICTDDAQFVREKYDEQKVLEYAKPLGPYYQNLSSVFKKIEDEYIIFIPEARMLQAPVKPGTFEYLIDEMKTRKIDGLYLRTCGSNKDSFDKNNIFKKFEGIGFAGSPAIWRRDVLVDLTERFKTHDYECGECSMIVNYVQATYQVYSIAHPDDKRAKFLPEQAYNSSVVPFISVTKRGHLVDAMDEDSDVDFFTKFGLTPPDLPWAKCDADTVSAEFIINHNKACDKNGMEHQNIFWWHPEYPFILKDGVYQIDKNLV